MLTLVIHLKSKSCVFQKKGSVPAHLGKLAALEETITVLVAWRGHSLNPDAA